MTTYAARTMTAACPGVCYSWWVWRAVERVRTLYLLMKHNTQGARVGRDMSYGKLRGSSGIKSASHVLGKEKRSFSLIAITDPFDDTFKGWTSGHPTHFIISGPEDLTLTKMS